MQSPVVAKVILMQAVSQQGIHPLLLSSIRRSQVGSPIRCKPEDLPTWWQTHAIASQQVQEELGSVFFYQENIASVGQRPS